MDSIIFCLYLIKDFIKDKIIESVVGVLDYPLLHLFFIHTRLVNE